MALRDKLGLQPHHFLCGISQIAIGADMVFTRACRELNIVQRIFLPQHRHEFLHASGDQGPDFTPEERAAAEELLASPHIIQERLVSDAADRTERFVDANLEIFRVSDVIICLSRAAAVDRPGGTGGLRELAKKQGTPLIDIRVSLQDGRPHCAVTWPDRKSLEAPELPGELSSLPAPCPDSPSQLPSVAAYCKTVKTASGRRARFYQGLFAIAALLVIGTHIGATICATIALVSHGRQVVAQAAARAPVGPAIGAPVGPAAAASVEQAADHDGHTASGFVIGLLVFELLLLGGGLAVHETLHHRQPYKLWAWARLLGEINRSVGALGRLHVYPEYLFHLPLPRSFRPLLRTLNILHLHSSRPHHAQAWEPLRSDYIRHRLRSRKTGQIRYYAMHLVRARRRLKVANGAFLTCSLLAILTTLLKLLTLAGWLPLRLFPVAAGPGRVRHGGHRAARAGGGQLVLGGGDGLSRGSGPLPRCWSSSARSASV